MKKRTFTRRLQDFIDAYLQEREMELRKQLCEMMPCGHPLAALNRQDQKNDGREHTMYCRSCSFDGAKELAKVLTANRGTVPSGETK